MSVSIGIIAMALGVISISFDYYGRFERYMLDEEIQETIKDPQPCTGKKQWMAKYIAAARARSEAVEEQGTQPDPIDDAIRWNADDRAEGKPWPPRYCAPGYDPPGPEG